MPLTPEQLARIEKNRLAVKRKREASLSNGSGSTMPSSSFQLLSQEITSSVNSKKENPYEKKSPFNRPDDEPSSQELQSSAILCDEQRKAQEAQQREQELLLLPPLPSDTPKLREATIQSLSHQQLDVVKLARPPTNKCTNDSTNGSRPGYMVRVTAAAGTGKTTTLLHLAVRCLDLGHNNVTYVTFARASASDAKERILQMMKAHVDKAEKDIGQCITASTIHSCAMQLVDDDNDIEKRLTDDNGIQRIIEREYADEIKAYLDPALKRIRDSSSSAATNSNGNEGASKDTQRDFKTLMQKERAMREQVVYYLKKSFLHFLHSKMTLEHYQNEQNFLRHWYPVQAKVFLKDGQAAKLGFPPEIYSLPKSYRFYADTCVKLWEYVVQNNIRTYDTEMKKAHMRNLRIPCSVLLVDECQDLDACQCAFVARQIEFGTQVFFVGDAAQSIYSFRGAKSANVMSLPKCVDRILNKSWRFGPAIAQIANVALFVKKYSPQTTYYEKKEDKLWMPYKIEAARDEDYSTVAPRSLLQKDWRNKRPITIIGRKNGTLLKKALELMDLGHLQQQGSAQTVEEQKMGSLGVEEDPLLDLEMLLARNMPKFHINGKGEASGTKAWRRSIKEIEYLYELYTADEFGTTLPPNLFPEFADYNQLSWGEFITTFKNLELNQYFKSVDVVMTYGRNTMKAVKVFEAQLDAKHSPEDADFILTTCNSAKGLEWDHVEICDDFLDLQECSYKCNHTAAHRPPFLCSDKSVDVKQVWRQRWQFNVEHFGDDLNFIYVACTRAKKTLALPKTIESLLREFDLIHFNAADFKIASKLPVESDESMIILEKEKRKLNKSEVWALYQDLCVPLREEYLGIADNEKIMSSLFGGDDDYELEEDKQLEIKGEDEHSQYFDC